MIARKVGMDILKPKKKLSLKTHFSQEAIIFQKVMNYLKKKLMKQNKKKTFKQPKFYEQVREDLVKF